MKKNSKTTSRAFKSASKKPKKVKTSAAKTAKKQVKTKLSLARNKPATTTKSVKYDHLVIEKKWQKAWEAQPNLYKASDTDKKREKLYMLVEFPFPSGAGLHAGHVRSYTALDIVARKNRMQGKNVLYPIGWDAFGLPTENYAIKTGVHPAISTKKNTENFERQLKSLAFSFDWSRTVDTTDPEYYKWTQWIFLQLLKKDLAYRDKISINWCPKDKIGLANEEVVGGCCERCGTKVEKREKEQWMLAITKYADRLDKDLDTVNYPERVKAQQRNWIGKSEGAELDFIIATKSQQEKPLTSKEQKISVFTTRPDTLFGVTYLVLAPEHKLVRELKDEIKNWSAVESFIKKVADKDEAERTAADKEKTGIVLEGISAIHPLSGEKVPVWIADYVLATYGTGAVMAVPAHDERDFVFAQKYKLPIKEVVIPRRVDETNPHQPGKKIVFRKGILGLVINPRTKKFLALKWKKQGWTTLVTGGVEEGEDPALAARREIVEETGYQKLKLIRVLGGPTQSEFFAAHKDLNRVAHTYTAVFELEDDSKPASVKQEEKDLHECVWLDMNKLDRQSLNHAEMDIINARLNSAPSAYGDAGVLIDSGEFSGQASEVAKVLITQAAKGRKVTKYKLRDWVFSRQRYWGEPIPVLHCGRCFAKSQASSHASNGKTASNVSGKNSAETISINFYKKEIWDALESGIKTVETRALNPEEPQRYFGDGKVGDIVKCIPKFDKAKAGSTKSILPLYFQIEDIKTFASDAKKPLKPFEDLFADQVWHSQIYSNPKAKSKNVAELRKGYAKLAPDYAERIERNGLVAWKFKKVTSVIPLPEKSLPLILPKVKKYEPMDNGESPLAAITSWVNMKCPVCSGPAKRETDTMPNWAGSSWYYLRYIDPKNKKAFADPAKLKYWTPVDWYNGGMEHTTLHLLYSRFWHKFLFDQKFVPTLEPYAKRTSHGLIMAGDGTKMSKSKGNVVNPDDIIKLYGADTLRLFEMFIGPFEQAVAWNSDGLIGPRRFIERVFRLHEKVEKKIKDKTTTQGALSAESRSLLHKTIKKITDDIETLAMNTAVSSLMILTNQLEKEASIPQKDFELYLALIAPFIPFAAEEINQLIGNTKTVHSLPWPAFDPAAIIEESVSIAVQINGKVRGIIQTTVGEGKNEKLMVDKAFDLTEIKKRLDEMQLPVDKFKEGRYEPDKIVFIPGKIVNLVYFK